MAENTPADSKNSAPTPQTPGAAPTDATKDAAKTATATPATPATPSASATPATPAKDAAAPSKASATAHAAADAAKHAAEAGFAVAKNAANRARGVLNVLIQIPIAILKLPITILQGDWTTKFLGIGFLASLCLMGMTAMQVYHHYLVPFAQRHKASKVDSGIGVFFKHEQEMTDAAARLVFLERFSTDVKSSSGKVAVFELEVFVDSDKPETSRFIRQKMTEVREAVGLAVQNQVYENLLTEDGKENLKIQIAKTIDEQLTKWHWKGKVKRVYFSRFIMG